MPEFGFANSLGFSGTPAFANRCFMLDVSRDRVPTTDTLHWLVDSLSMLGYNQLQLYVEHAFEFAGHEQVWGGASPLSAAEVERLAHYAADAGVELVANLNTFGHMERWLRHDGYRHRAECPDGMPEQLQRLRSSPTCLAPTPENAEFSLGLVRELLEVTGGNRVMIGGDEPFELGAGVSADLAAEIGREELYRRHLKRIIEPLVADGFEVLFWGDHFRTDPDSVEWIPEGSVCVVWNYEAPQPTARLMTMLPEDLCELLGLPADADEGFAAHARLAMASGKPTWLACGTSSWNSFLGRSINAAANIDDAAVVGAAGGATGFMLTDWGDNGHWQPLAVSLPSMVRAAAAAWTGRPVDGSVDVGAVVDEILGAPAGSGALIEQLGTISETIGTVGLNGSAPFYALVTSGLPTVGELDRDATHGALALLGDARSQFTAAQELSGTTRWGIAAQELDAACAATQLGLRRLLGDEPSASEFQHVINAQRAAWLRSSRPGGLEDSLARLLIASG